jgi:hypothetical protein
MESQDLQDAMVVLVLMEFLEQPDPQAHLAQRVKQVLPVLQVKMARLDLQGLQVQLALPVPQVPQDLLVQQVRKVQQVEMVKMHLCTQLNLTLVP